MKNISLLLATLILASHTAWARAAVDPKILEVLKSHPQKTTQVVVLLKNNTTGLIIPRRYDHRGVYIFLKKQNAQSWKIAQDEMRSSGVSTGDIRIRQIFMINNSFSATVNMSGLQKLAQLNSIEKVYWNHPVTYDHPVSVQKNARPPARNEISIDLKILKMDQVYADFPQATGQGVFVGHIDTGIDGKHPALANKIAIFYDGVSKKRVEPTDKQSHGTHTAGTIVGDGPNRAHMGVAPGAKLIAAGFLDSYESMTNGMEMMLDPDGNPETKDHPRMVSNSWNCEGSPDLEIFYRAIEAWEAGGILPVFSAGNAGPGSRTITKPHEHPMTLAIAALDKNAKIASFSSRGPGIFHGKETAKPDVSAPGVNVISSVPGGGYESMSGTSMASPHAAGVMALVVQANPSLNPAQLRDVAAQSAVHVNSSGAPQAQLQWNASYGYGVLDAYAALKLVTKKGVRAVAELAFQTLGLHDQTSHLMDVKPEITTPVFENYETDENNWVRL